MGFPEKKEEEAFVWRFSAGFKGKPQGKAKNLLVANFWTSTFLRPFEPVVQFLPRPAMPKPWNHLTQSPRVWALLPSGQVAV